MKRFLFVACLLMFEMGSAHSGIISGTASNFTGDTASVNVTMDDMAGSGKIRISVNVNTTIAIGDLRGIFFHIADETLLTSGTFSIADPASSGSITTSTFGPANSLTSVGGNSNNLNGGNSPGPFDLGFEIGSAGIGENDYQSVAFTLMHSTTLGPTNLSLSLFDNQSFGVRLMSVGLGRNGSSKLAGILEIPDLNSGPTPSPGTVPEPATLAIWSILGICVFGAARRKRTAKA